MNSDNISTLSISPDTFDVAYLSANLVNTIINKPLNTLIDGLRISRYEGLNQEYRWNYINKLLFTWINNATTINVFLNGIDKGLYNSANQLIDGLNDCNTIFTYGWIGHNYIKGFSTGVGCIKGWQYSHEQHAIPMTKVWVRE